MYNIYDILYTFYIQYQEVKMKTLAMMKKRTQHIKAIRISVLLVIFIAIMLVLPMSTTASGNQQDEKKIEEKSGNFKEAEALYKKAKLAVYKKDWDTALKGFRRVAEAFSNNKWTDDSLYWLGYSLKKSSEHLENLDEYLKTYETALRNLEHLMRTFPSSRWVDDARLLKVEIAEELVKKGFSQYKKYIINRASGEADLDMKLAALNALLNTDKEKAMPMLEKFIRTNKDSRLRQKAILVLSQTCGSEAIPLLTELVQNDTDKKVRETAVFWLGNMADGKNKELLNTLGKLYKSMGNNPGDTRLKEKIIFAISRTGDEGVSRLIKMYKSEKDVRLKKKIIFWLGQSQNEDALAFIQEILLNAA
jgi:outer membrane protein assembly factor BamD (BamD/ComL family)